ETYARRGRRTRRNSRPREWARTLLHGRVQHLGRVFPIDQVIHERLEVIGPPVAIIDVVRMLPDIAAEDGLASLHQRVLAVRRLGYDDLAVLYCKPAPP